MYARTPLILPSVLFLLGESQGSLAEKRVALVIGNSGYGSVPKLSNPANDAEAVGILLKSADFEVVEIRRDMDIAAMRRAINNFSGLTQNADTAVVFYAGHGIEECGWTRPCNYPRLRSILLHRCERDGPLNSKGGQR